MRGLFLSAVLLLLVNTLPAQSYTPFPEDTAVWEVIYYNIPGGPHTIYDYYRYTLSGDTVVNAASYNKIYLQHYREALMQVPTYTYYPVVYFAGLRQDSVNRKVYTLVSGEPSEKLLYDFSINGVGDTVNTCFVTTPGANYNPGYQVQPCQPIVIWQIDSVLTPWNKYYRAYNFDACQMNWNGATCSHLYPTAHPFTMNSGSLLEGIGSCWGLFEKLESTYEFAGWGLNYFCDSRYGPCDARPLGISAKSNDIKVQIAPNPFADHLEISNAPDKTIISIYDALGNLYLTREITGQSTRLDVSLLAKGIYFAGIQTSAGKTTRKIIKD